MQEVESANRVTSVYKKILSALAVILLFSAWALMVAASFSLGKSIIDYGILDIRIFLDAGLGYYGFFSFGISSFAALLAAKGSLKSNQNIFRLFKMTLLVSIFFIVPVFLSIIISLIN